MKNDELCSVVVFLVLDFIALLTPFVFSSILLLLVYCGDLPMFIISFRAQFIFRVLVFHSCCHRVQFYLPILRDLTVCVINLIDVSGCPNACCFLASFFVCGSVVVHFHSSRFVLIFEIIDMR
jgi:hypothetical protein